MTPGALEGVVPIKTTLAMRLSEGGLKDFFASANQATAIRVEKPATITIV
jgi:hypothetical protein